MNARLIEIEKIIDDYEKKLRKLDRVITEDSSGNEVNLNLDTRSIKDFLKDFFYHNHVVVLETGKKTFHRTSQQKVKNGSIESTFSGQRRTTGDLFRLALKYYSDEVSLYEIMEALFYIVNDRVNNRIYYKSNSSNFGVMYMNVCSTIHRRVFNFKSGDYTNYKFNSSNEYQTQTTNLEEEFNILGTDYNLLFDTKDGKELVEKKKNKSTLFAIPNNLSQLDLDRLVEEKLKKLKKKTA